MEFLHKNSEKISKISEFMKELLDDKSLLSKREIYDKYEEIINQVQPIDFFFLDMYKEESDFTIEEIKRSAGKFINVFLFLSGCTLKNASPFNVNSRFSFPNLRG